MIGDSQLEYSNKQAVTAAAASTNLINHGSKGDLGLSDTKYICLTVNTPFLASGAATLSVQLQTDDNNAFSSPKVISATAAIPKAELIMGKQFFIPIPVGFDEKFSRLYYDVQTGPFTAGAISAIVVDGIQKNIAYPDAI